MIDIQDKKYCCGCEACAQRCPRHCIGLSEDAEGFLYPRADASLCIQCGLCESVCPVIHQGAAREPISVFAAKNPDWETRRQSSSGGVFTLLAERTIAAGGVVFGARFDESWEVVHSHTETLDGLAAFRGSKYAQSHIGDSFRQAERFLRQGREVLFCGTPCQIAGLRRYLRKDYKNLLAVDFICHGVPSPGVFRRYLAEEMLEAGGAPTGATGKHTVPSPASPFLPERGSLGRGIAGIRLRAVSFRDKRLGWKKYSLVLSFSNVSAEMAQPFQRNPFMRGFLSDLYLRPSCYACPAKSLKSGSDITLGDYWGIAATMPDYDDDRGVSAVTANTVKGSAALRATAADLRPAPWADLCQRNPALLRPCAVPARRAAFFAADGLTFLQKIRRLCRPTLRARLRGLAYGALTRLLTPRMLVAIKRLLGR